MGGFTCLAPDVQDALEVAIATQIAAVGDEVAFRIGHPGKSRTRRHMWIETGFRAKHPRRTSGGRQRDDEASLVVRILLVQAVETAAPLRDDAMSIAQLVEDALAADPTLGGLVQEAYVTGTDGDEGMRGTDREFGVTLTIAYSASVARSG